MNIICNTCVGGRIYEQYKLQYTNPFIWNAINTPDFMYLVKNYDNIKFNNFKLFFENDIYQINIDNVLTITYPHYKYDPNIVKPTIKSDKFGTHMYSNNIDKYIVDRYIERLDRMNEPPTFILIKGTTFGKNIKCLDNDIEYFINIDTKYNKIVYTDKVYDSNIINNTTIINGQININSVDIAKTIISNIEL